MAEVLDPRTFERIAKRRPRSFYDFAKWSDGQVWKLTRGIDFHCTTNTINGYLYRYAESIGMKVRTSSRRTASGKKNSITFQFTERGNEHPFPANTLEEFNEDECEIADTDSASPTTGRSTRCVVWDALRERIGITDSPQEGIGFKHELQFPAEAEYTLL